MSDWNPEIDRLLAERRPDRYEPDGGDEWLDGIADEVAPLIPASRAQVLAAGQAVRQRETQKLRHANRLLREIYETRQLPLGWMDCLTFPISVGKERVALRACTAKDLQGFASDERRDAAKEFTTRNLTCEAAEWIADQLIAAGAKYARELQLEPGEDAA